MSHSLAVAKPPVFASFRAKGSRSSARPPEAEGSTVEHRLDLLMDRLDQLEFTVSRLFDTDTDGHEDDRLAQIETRLHAMHDQLAALADSRRAATALDARLDAMQDLLASLAGGDAALGALAEDMETRHDALLDTLSSLATSDEAKTSRIAQSAAAQQQQFETLQTMIGSLAAKPPAAAGEAAILQAIADLADRQGATQAQMNARFAAFERRLADDAFDALSFRMSRLVDARLAAGFANLADALDRVVETQRPGAEQGPGSREAEGLDDPRAEKTDGTSGQEGCDQPALIARMARSCRNAASAGTGKAPSEGA